MSSSSSALNYLSSSSDDEKDFDFLTLVVAAAKEQEEADTATSKKRYVPRDRIQAHNQLLDDYFRGGIDGPKYNAKTFRTRFRLPKELFMKIVDDIEARFEWFQEGYDARGKRSFAAIQKCTSAIRQLEYGNPPDSYDEYLAMSARTSRECLEFFCNAVIILYEKEFLRRPTSHDVALLQNAHGSYHNLPGMLGSLDCTHWEWRMCPTLLQGQFQRGDHPHPSIMLEAVASQDLWIWHAYFGAPGSNNDINVLHRSPLFNDITLGTAPNTSFYLNERLYKYGYYLTDGIYPKWAVFVKAYLYPTEPKEIRFKRVQEGARKDVERAFGVLKSKWAILSRPWDGMVVAPSMVGVLGDGMVDKMVDRCNVLIGGLLGDEGDGMDHPPHPNNILFPLIMNSKPDFRLKVLKVQYDYLPTGGALAFAFDVSPQGEGNTFIEVVLLYDTLKYKDPKQPLNVRIKDLLNRMTLEEKIAQMIQIDRSVASADVMQKYFIGSILSGGGSVPAKQATPEMWINMVNGFQNGSLASRLGIPMTYGIDAVHGDATALEVCRDPRWGRCFESYSEDPTIVRQMTELILGLQADIPASSRKGVPFFGRKEKVVACAKHFIGDGGTTKGINENNTVISPHG
ncbi:hypothetical protein QVD17_21102 [Tagetes erecta]|uniref:Glycoside hydrolase family 3 N-terminal domain-containing protein n=1 Tax=Tagetes erecta TaxID=13708 RepID=A0AAD8NYL3_TARER|nr:hypothetical protein QVD17_21102 [Tagetes erecta]